MLTLETLTLADLREVINDTSLDRALGYVSRIRTAVRSGEMLTARVSGSAMYDVEIEVGPDIVAHCTCPYDWGGYCKHIGAVLLKWIDSPSSFTFVEAPEACADPESSSGPLPTSRPKKYPFWLCEPSVEDDKTAGARLSSWLRALSVNDLRDMARQRGWLVKGTRKDDIIEQLIERLLDPSEIRKGLLDLDAEHRHVFRAILLLGKHLTTEDLTDLVELWDDLIGPSHTIDCVDHLCELGLSAIESDAPYGGVRSSYGTVYIPEMIARHVPPMLGEVIANREKPFAGNAAAESYMADTVSLVRSVHQVISMLERHPVSLRSSISRPEMAKYSRILNDWDYDADELLAAGIDGRASPYRLDSLSVPPPACHLPDETIELLAPLAGGKARLEFIYSHLVAAGVFQPGSPVTIWPEVHEQFFRRPPHTQRAILARTYFRHTEWNELWDMLRSQEDLQLRRSLSSSSTSSQFKRSLVYFRQLVLRVLSHLPDNRWVRLEDLQLLMWRVLPSLDSNCDETRTYYHPSRLHNWYLVRKNTTQPLAPDVYEDWLISGWNFVMHVITGPLYWLGLVDLRFEKNALAEIRLHDLSDLFWGRTETLPMPDSEDDNAAIWANGDAVRFEDYSILVNPVVISHEAHDLLARIARIDKVTPQRFAYTLSVRSAHATFETGQTIEDILVDWDALLPVPMPAEIREQLVRWWESYGQVRIYQDVSIIEFGDDYALAEMKAVTSLEKYLIAEISPRAVLISPTATDTLIDELEKAGYTPKHTRQD